MQLEVGKYYLTRDFEEVLCLGIDPYLDPNLDVYICMRAKGGVERYFQNGNWMAPEQTKKYDKDIIQEAD